VLSQVTGSMVRERQQCLQAYVDWCVKNLPASKSLRGTFVELNIKVHVVTDWVEQDRAVAPLALVTSNVCLQPAAHKKRSAAELSMTLKDLTEVPGVVPGEGG